MKNPSPASLKRLNAANLEQLGAQRLAQLLVEISAGRAELKRRLRMELAAAQGAEHLAPEIDKRLRSLETSTGKISWRARPAFLRDLEGLRGLISDRMASLDSAAALERLWRLMATARQTGERVRGREEELGAIYTQAASDIGRLAGGLLPALVASDLARALAANPKGWEHWLPGLLHHAPVGLAGEALDALRTEHEGAGRLVLVVRQLADAAGDIDAFASTFSPNALLAPPNAAELAVRLLKFGRTGEAGEILRAAAPEVVMGAGAQPARRGAPELDFGWESAWIDYLDLTGRGDEAQAVRWASFERTLSVERLRAFTGRLKDFDDVEAEQRAFAYVAEYPSFRAGLRFLMNWPALPEAAQMIQRRDQEINISVEEAVAWSAKLRARQPRAAGILLRRAAAAAFRRREYKTSDRLTQDADAIEGA